MIDEINIKNGSIMNKLLLSIFLTLGVMSQQTVAAQADVAQDHLINQFTRYFEIKGRESEASKSNYQAGLCNGFAFLAQYYASLGQEDDFFEALSLISTWDGQQESLQEKKTLMDRYPSLEELFEHWINDLVWLQYSYLILDSTGLETQANRIDQFECIKNKDETRKIEVLFAPIYIHVSRDQLEELLEIWSSYPSTILEFGGGVHVTSARVLENGKFFYYDANFSQKHEIVNSPKELATLIFKTKYKRWKGGTAPVELMAYQYVRPGEQAQRPTKKIKNRKKSPNGFTEAHMAIWANDLEALHQNKSNPNAAEKHDLTPLTLAVLLDNKEAVEALLQHPSIDLEAGRCSPLLLAVQNLNLESTIMFINNGANLFVTQKERLDFMELAQSKTPGLVLNIPAIIMGRMKSPRELAYMQDLVKQIPDLIKLQDAHGYTLLHFAAMQKNKDLVDLLLKMGADPHQKSQDGVTAQNFLES